MSRRWPRHLDRHSVPCGSPTEGCVEPARALLRLATPDATFLRDEPRAVPAGEKNDDESRNSYLPHSNAGGQLRPWFSLRAEGVGGSVSFAGQLIQTARTWVDGGQLTMPGYRDRIVTVHHSKSEGGMNLNMPGPVVTALSERGRHGAVKLLPAFAGEAPGEASAPGWENHRWIRFRAATAGLHSCARALRERLPSVTRRGHTVRVDGRRERHGRTTVLQAELGRGAQAAQRAHKVAGRPRRYLDRRRYAVGRGPAASAVRLVPDDGTPRAWVPLPAPRSSTPSGTESTRLRAIAGDLTLRPSPLQPRQDDR